ncbi:MAG TPA: patatin-like phospholipase family protein, partial [Xanthobacteraceae bacterium]|nr:patatin-like phospholipase family protein [Xanthobacteraceae bacterium]
TAANERERNALGGKPLPTAYFLAISGGGDDGAFGSGLLVGWTAHGDRPQFKLVTGISTGALSAPFAFLGSKYDSQLRDIYTQIEARNVFERRSIIAAVADDALAGSEPLRQTILRYLTDEVVAAIAEEYKKGRLLLVMTTNLDAGRPVIWNIGAIATSAEPRKREIIARTLLASASIPAFLPPVLFDVEIEGQRYQEMHVDGGAVAQVFLYPPGLAGSSKFAKRKRVAYVIRNGRFAVAWQQVGREAITIAGRASATMITSNGGGDLYRIYATAKRDGVDFNYAYIGNDFDTPYRSPFQPEYMNKLYEYGFELGRRGYRWEMVPPGFNG